MPPTAKISLRTTIATVGIAPMNWFRTTPQLVIALAALWCWLPVSLTATADERQAAGGDGATGTVREDQATHDWKESTVLIETPLGGTNRATGSGLIVTTSGYVISARHVIEVEGHRTARFADGKAYPLRLVAAPRNLDLALLKIDADRTFTPFPLANSAVVKIGDTVVAAGNPRGAGLVSCSGNVRAIGTTWAWGGPYSDQMIDFDAPISGGNSGGPLLNERGAAIGVVFSVAIGAPNVSFAYPINGTLDFLRKTIAEEGLYFFELGMDVPAVGPARVAKLTPGSPAERAGVQVGDVILQVDKFKLRGGFDFHLALIGRAGGETLSIELARTGKTLTVPVTLGKGQGVPAVEVAKPARGLRLEYYEGNWERLPDFATLKPLAHGVAETVGVNAYQGKDHFALRLAGYLRVAKPGRYVFYLASDDGARLEVAGRMVVQDDGLHEARQRRGLPLHLEQGLHPMTVTYFEHSANESLRVLWEGPGFGPLELPATELFHAAER